MKKEISNQTIYRRQTLMYWAIFVVGVIMSIYGYAEVQKMGLMMDDPCEACREYISRSNNNCVISCFPPLTEGKNEQEPLVIINHTEIK